MFKIGEFAKLTHVSVRMLRHYEKIGLFSPAKTDPDSDYRYYSADQLPRLNRILALHELGFTLSQVSDLMREDVDASQIRGMLLLKKAETEQLVEEEQKRLERIEARLKLIEMEGVVPANETVILKSLESVKVARVRGKVAQYDHEHLGPELGRMYGQLVNHIMKNGGQIVGPAIAMYPDEPGSKTELRVEAAMPVGGSVPSQDEVEVATLPAVAQAACTIHHGPMETIHAAYQAIARWMEKQGYRATEAAREVYLVMPEGGDPSQFVTEIQFPVEHC